MPVVQLRSKVPDAKAEAYVGRRGAPEDFALVVPKDVAQDVTVYKPNGELLLKVVPNAISVDSRDRAMTFLQKASRAVSKNRGTFLGGQSNYVKADGTLSNTTQTPPIRTSIHGFFDRSPRFPFCRQTALVSREPAAFAEVFPMLADVARTFQEGARSRYMRQLEAAQRTHPAYVIPGTPFTTLTVNGTLAGAYHRDAGDYKPGFGCIAVFRTGHYLGCLLGFPAFGVAVDLPDRSVILFDPHEIHGNTSLEGEGVPNKDFQRISVVAYYREKMLECLSPAEELTKAKDRGGIAADELHGVFREDEDADVG